MHNVSVFSVFQKSHGCTCSCLILIYSNRIVGHSNKAIKHLPQTCEKPIINKFHNLVTLLLPFCIVKSKHNVLICIEHNCEQNRLNL